MQGSWTRVLIFGLLGGCAGAPHAGAGRPPPAGPSEVGVSLQVDQVLPGGRRPLRAGQVLHSGDRFAMKVTLDRAAYVYVLQVLPNGTSALLFPGEGDAERDRPARPGRPLQAPPAGESFALDDTPGPEALYVIAATRPIGQADPDLARRFGLLRPVPPPLTTSRDVSAAADPPPPPPPIPVKITERGICLPGEGAGSIRRMQRSAGGVAVLCFPFQHEAAARP